MCGRKIDQDFFEEDARHHNRERDVVMSQGKRKRTYDSSVGAVASPLRASVASLILSSASGSLDLWVGRGIRGRGSQARGKEGEEGNGCGGDLHF